MKEKIDREIRIKVQESLYKKFRENCEKEFKTVSIVLRELMTDYTKNDKYG